MLPIEVLGFQLFFKLELELHLFLKRLHGIGIKIGGVKSLTNVGSTTRIGSTDGIDSTALFEKAPHFFPFGS